jgi:hypothetical protein
VAELLEANPDLLGVIAGLTQVMLEPVAVAATRCHGDLRLQDAHKRELGRPGLVEVLQNLLVRRRHVGSDLIGGGGLRRNLN